MDSGQGTRRSGRVPGDGTVRCRLLPVRGRLVSTADCQFDLSDDELCLRHCGYWLSLSGHNPVSNRNSVTVRIPTANVFSSAQLTEMMDKAAKGEAL